MPSFLVLFLSLHMISIPMHMPKPGSKSTNHIPWVHKKRFILLSWTSNHNFSIGPWKNCTKFLIMPFWNTLQPLRHAPLPPTIAFPPIILFIKPSVLCFPLPPNKLCHTAAYFSLASAFNLSQSSKNFNDGLALRICIFKISTMPPTHVDNLCELGLYVHLICR